MTHSRWFNILSISSAFTAPACVDQSDGFQSEASADGTRVHMLRLHNPDDKVSEATPSGAHVTNFGGPILTHIDIHPVYWNSNVQFQSTLTPFYQDIANSPFFSMLTEYNALNGTGQAGIVDSRSTANGRDSTVQAELANLINSGRLPAPTANTYYPVHFPSGMSITAPDGSQSCVVFCAYHGTFRAANGVSVNYGVIPDQGTGGCATGCGTNSQRVNNLTSVASGELAEAATDPAVGLATTLGPPLAWYDPNNGEIGDICNAQQGTTTINAHVYTTQKVWSNSMNACCW